LILSLIVAMSRDGLIGDGRGMPWHLPRDLKRFRKLTLGKPVIMGRRTFESLGRPLDRRVNIVLTRDHGYHAEGCLVAHTVPDALWLAMEHSPTDEAAEFMVIGGGEVYRGTIGLCDRVYQTIVEGEFEGSTSFPIERLSEPDWRLVREESFPADDVNPHPHVFRVLERAPMQRRLRA
jgi:dihydrofolate reductase